MKRIILCLVTSSTVFAATAAGEPSPERQKELVRLVRQDCGSCHGMTLNGGLGPALSVQALKERDIPKEDAERMVDNALAAYGQGVQKLRELLAEAEARFKDTGAYLENLAASAREKADELASAAAKAALASAVALMLAAVISTGAGACGAKYAPAWAVVQQSYSVR